MSQFFKQTLLKSTLDAAYHWLCESRQHHSPNSDIWNLRRDWLKRQDEILNGLQQGNYQFSPRLQYRFEEETISLYCSEDSLALKTISLTLGQYLKDANCLSSNCYHLKGHDGLKAAVNFTHEQLKQYKFVFKSDIKGYYANINHDRLCEELLTMTDDDDLTALVRRSIEAPSTWGGLYYDHLKGIPRGSSLSPLLGAVALNPLDIAMEAIDGVVYARYMDDWVVLCKTRNQLRKVIKRTYQVLDHLQLKLHPDKTFIGRVAKGFDFLGYHFTPDGLSASKITLERAHAKLQQLFKQGANLKRLVDYWQRFTRWLNAAVDLSTSWKKPMTLFPRLILGKIASGFLP